MGIDTAQDRRLVRDALEGDARAGERLAARVAAPVRTACRLLTGDEAEAARAFAEVAAALRADGFRRLRPYDGSSRLETFAALVARDILAERLLSLFHSGSAAEGWAAFESFFRADIVRIIARRMPGADGDELRRDAYQEVCLGLVADGYRRVKAYRGEGSFTGFILHMVDRLAIDGLRRTAGGRQRPVMIPLSEDEEPVCTAPNPEQSVLEREGGRLLAQAAQALRDTAATLSEAERLYLRVALGGGAPLPARDVARLMGRPVEEVYKLKQRVMTRLREVLAKHPAVKNWRASV